MRCPHLKKARTLIFDKDGNAFCRTCYNGPRGDSRVYTGRKVWVGNEVYTERQLKSDELRQDTEDQLTKKNWPPWFEDRMKKAGRSNEL